VNVEVHYGLFLQSFANSEKFFEVIEKQKSICERGRNDKKLAKTRFTLFPEEEVKIISDLRSRKKKSLRE
jgi:hypothetical protein